MQALRVITTQLKTRGFHLAMSNVISGILLEQFETKSPCDSKWKRKPELFAQLVPE